MTDNDNIDEAETFEAATARTFIEHGMKLAEHEARHDGHATDLRRDVEELGRHDKRLTKLAGRVDNANRVITETRDELGPLKADIDRLGGHVTDHEHRLDAATVDIYRIAKASAMLGHSVKAMEARLGAHASLKALYDDESIVLRSRFEGVAELVETIYARVRAADAWMMQAVDPEPEEVAAHHARIAAVLATMHATLCIDDRRREDDMRANVEHVEEWSREIKTYAADDRQAHEFTFSQCTRWPCNGVPDHRRAAYECARGGSSPTASRPAAMAFATEAADAMAAVGEFPNAAALAEVAGAFAFHATPDNFIRGHVADFADCRVAPCSNVSRAMRYIYANSSAGLASAYAHHESHFGEFDQCTSNPCGSADPGNRAQYALTVIRPTGVTFHGGPGEVVHIAGDGLTVHTGPVEQCTASGCVKARADLKAAYIEQAWNTHGEHRVNASTEGDTTTATWTPFEACGLKPCVDIGALDRAAFADKRGEPNDPSREG